MYGTAAAEYGSGEPPHVGDGGGTAGAVVSLILWVLNQLFEWLESVIRDARSSMCGKGLPSLPDLDPTGGAPQPGPDIHAADPDNLVELAWPAGSDLTVRVSRSLGLPSYLRCSMPSRSSSPQGLPTPT